MGFRWPVSSPGSGGARGVRFLVFAAAAALTLASRPRGLPAPDPPNLIGGPFGRLLANSTDLGAAGSGQAQLTVALRDSTRPKALIGRAKGQDLLSLLTQCDAAAFGDRVTIRKRERPARR